MLGVAIAASTTGAVAAKLLDTPAAQEPVYQWQSTNIAPENPNSNAQLTRPDAISYFGCENGNQLCAEGTLVSGSGDETSELFHGM
ncbi:hypothetical protein H8S90_13850 [Olivibacter sp. SDN3]|uniref:hypothetical protein n=1 Tax=Olivibacter sp. SDN3 TaxID=2764720 RepID=UPI00165146B3|nr:hypothetical protein [Olivibacter sp. SDN3]QNL47902.1 hypothetical protein H8S90_13850 [Olivibacter sp. SDN3]